jgi:hypothetical protein
LDEHEFEPVDGAPATAAFIKCKHGSDFPSCVACTEKTKVLLEEHDRTNQPVRSAAFVH